MAKQYPPCGMGGCRNKAKWEIGPEANWRVCASCAKLWIFRKYRKRVPIMPLEKCTSQLIAAIKKHTPAFGDGGCNCAGCNELRATVDACEEAQDALQTIRLEEREACAKLIDELAAGCADNAQFTIGQMRRECYQIAARAVRSGRING